MVAIRSAFLPASFPVARLGHAPCGISAGSAVLQRSPLRAVRRFAAGRRLALVRRFAVVRRFEVAPRFPEVRRFEVVPRFAGVRFFRDEREVAARFLRFAMSPS